MSIILLIPYYALVFLSWRWALGGGMILSEFGTISGSIWGRTITAPDSFKKIRNAAIVKVVLGVILFVIAIVFFYPINAQFNDTFDLDPWDGAMWYVVLIGMMLFFLACIALGCLSGIKLSKKVTANLYRAHFAVDALDDLPLMSALKQPILQCHKFHMYVDGFSFYDHTGYCLGGTDFRKWRLGDLNANELKLLRLYLLQKYPEFSYKDVTRSEKTGPETTTVYHTHTFIRK